MVTGVVVVDETGSVEQSSPIHGEVESVKSVVVSVFVEVDDIAVVQSSQGFKMMSSIAIASSAFPPQKA